MTNDEQFRKDDTERTKCISKISNCLFPHKSMTISILVNTNVIRKINMTTREESKTLTAEWCVCLLRWSVCNEHGI